MIDRDSPVPVYFQIQQDLRDRIAHREWDLDQLMPSETELTKHYGVSRVTLRQALAELEKDRLIKRYRGKGAFVTGISPKPFVHDLNYELVTGERIARQDYSMTAQILSLDYVTPLYPDIAEKLKIKDEQYRAIFLKRLFFLEGKPIAIGKSWLPSHLLPDFVEKGMINNSLSQTLADRYNIIVDSVDDYIEVVRSTHSESSLLNCTLDVPLLLIQGISYLKGGIPLECSQTSWLGDGVRFHFHLHNTDKGFVMGG